MTTDVHGLTGAYVLDAVDDIERAAFDRHLATCEACATEVAQLREVAVKLGALAEEPSPPALRDRVLAEVSRTPQLGPATSRTHTVPAGERRWRRAALAAIAAGLVAIAGTWAVMDSRLSEERSRVQALQYERARIYAVMNAEDVRMRGTDMPGGGRIAAAVSNSEQAGVAMLAGLPAPPSGEVYQMWLIGGGNSTSAVVLQPGVSGGTMLFSWEPGFDRFGITIEPEGGSATPTRNLIATINLA
jgi:anti-sigma factor RsiW